jgi:hypothetical protein
MKPNDIICPSCGVVCGKFYPANAVDPGFREGIGEEFMDEFLNFHCSQACLDKAKAQKDLDADEDLCGLCGEPGADKIPHPLHWPGEAIPDTPLVHAECEQEECKRAHSLLTDKQREAVLRSI